MAGLIARADVSPDGGNLLDAGIGSTDAENELNLEFLLLKSGDAVPRNEEYAVEILQEGRVPVRQCAVFVRGVTEVGDGVLLLSDDKGVLGSACR